jgi:trimethylamine--corrinoid protein Co-methyltransferase
LALAGTNIIYGAGMLESGVTFDLAELVVDNEIAAMIRKFVGGVPVSDDTLALEEIHAVGPFGDYLGTDFTYAHMRDLSTPKLLDRRVRSEWEADGALDMRGRAIAKAKEILAEHRPEPLPDEASAFMRRVIEDVEALV